jgi:hypothetical protein
MDTHHLSLLLVREMPYGKFKGRKIADLPATTWGGSPARAFRTANWANCWP